MAAGWGGRCRLPGTEKHYCLRAQYHMPGTAYEYGMRGTTVQGHGLRGAEMHGTESADRVTGCAEVLNARNGTRIARFGVRSAMPNGLNERVGAGKMVMDELFMPIAREFKPDLVLVSAGFDAA
eukprot:1658924-Rhodomonas_salina.1